VSGEPGIRKPQSPLLAGRTPPMAGDGTPRSQREKTKRGEVAGLGVAAYGEPSSGSRQLPEAWGLGEVAAKSEVAIFYVL